MKKCVIYLRVSTDKQETDRQRDELLQYASQLGYEVLEVIEDVESGLKDERPGFLKLLTLSSKDIDAVLVWELSRIGRKTSTVIKTIEDWTEAGICFISKKENLRSLDEDGKLNPNTKLYLSVMATIAENEAATIKARMRSGKIHKLRSGESTHSDKVPFGYRKVDNRLVINESEAELVKKAFRMKSEGYSVKVIAEAIGRKGGTTEDMLHSEIYRGIGRNKYVPDMVFQAPRIVDDELWHKCQVRNPAVKRSSGALEFVPLRGKIVCPICGRKMSYQAATRKVEPNGKVKYSKPAAYKCSKTIGSIDGVVHPKYSATMNCEDVNSGIRQAVEAWRTSKKKTSVKFDDPESIKSYVKSLESQLSEKRRALDISRKKYEAVSSYLTETEKRSEIRHMASLEDSADSLELEISSARLRLDNAIALKSAAFLPGESQPWHELVKEVRLTSWSRLGRGFQVETVSGDLLEVFVKTRFGCCPRD